MNSENKRDEKLKRVLNGLTGITKSERPNSSQEQVSKQQVLMTGLYDPPSYFVLMLMVIAGFSAYGDWDKSRWQFYIEYKGIHFCLRDWKMSSWSIDALEMSIDKRSVIKIAEELRTKIVKTGRNLEKNLQLGLQNFIDQNYYALPNPYQHLRNLYEYFREQVQETQREIKNTEIPKPKDAGIEVVAVQKTFFYPLDEDFAVKKSHQSPKPSELNKEHKEALKSFEDSLRNIVDIHNKILKLENIASYNACAMVSFFFSYIEFLMDTLYIFYPAESMAFHDFQEQPWRERFKTVFPVDNDQHIGRIYRKLLEIRDGWRNVIEHGFRSKEESLLIPLPGIGFVPISYTNASKAIHFAQTPSPKNGIQDALDIFSSFDAWAASNQKTTCIILFTQYSNIIPLMENRLQEIRKWMSSPEILKKALDEEEEKLQSSLDQYE